MAAAEPTTLSIITSALRKLGVMGAAQSTPKAEDLELALHEFNEVSELRNLRERNCFYQRTQQFTFTTSKQTYSIGATADAPDFIVTAGRRPVTINYAQLILTGSSPNVNLQVSNLTDDQYQMLSLPDLSAEWPWALYYVPTWPNGTIRPYPAYPTDTTNKLELTWSNQFETVAIADVSTALILPFGYRRGLALDVAYACYPSFPKRTNLDELKTQRREAWIEITSANKRPAFISTTDGVQPDSCASSFDWRSRMWG